MRRQADASVTKFHDPRYLPDHSLAVCRTIKAEAKIRIFETRFWLI